MNLQPSNILYVYNSEDEDSVLLSNEYASLRQIPESNMLGIDNLTKSILNDRKQFDLELLFLAIIYAFISSSSSLSLSILVKKW